MTDSSPDAGRVPTIAELVQARIDAGGSERRLSDATGDVVSFQQIHRLKRGDVKAFPKDAGTIRALARALGVDERAVVLGYAAQLGLDVNENRSPLATRLHANASVLPASLVDALSLIVNYAVVTETRLAEAGTWSPWRREEARNVERTLRSIADGMEDGAERALILHRADEFHEEYDQHAAHESPEPAGAREETTP